MLTYNLVKSGIPLYEQLYNYIKDDISKGVLEGNFKMPSKRLLSEHLGVSKITVETAYSNLISEGYLYSIEKKGYYVEPGIFIQSAHHKSVTDNNIIDDVETVTDKAAIDLISNAIPPHQFPFDTWSKLMRNVCLDYREELLMQIPFAGCNCLRKAISKYLLDERGITVSYRNIYICFGSENAYNFIFELLDGYSFSVENPNYYKIFRILINRKIKPGLLSIDSNGPSVADIKKNNSDVIHISPNHNFPTGVVTSPKRRSEILNWCSSSKSRFIIEDDFDSELRLTGKPISTVYSMTDSDNVIYLNSFSKTIAPSVKISYVILPDRLLEKAEHHFRDNSCSVSSFEQYTLAEFISRGYFQRHLNRTRKYYKNLREELISVYSVHPVSGKSRLIDPQAGLHFMIELNTDKGDDYIKTMLSSKNVLASVLSEYYYNMEKDLHKILINYSGIDADNFRYFLDILNEIY